MIRSTVRILTGLIAAYVAAGLVQALFVVTPWEMAGAATPAERLETASYFAGVAATQSAVFATPFAVLAVLFAEWQGIRSWVFYALAGLAIALAGFAAQYSSEGGGATIMNDYAFRAFLTTGFVAGFVYWMIAGRSGGGAAVPPSDPDAVSSPVWTPAPAPAPKVASTAPASARPKPATVSASTATPVPSPVPAPAPKPAPPAAPPQKPAAAPAASPTPVSAQAPLPPTPATAKLAAPVAPPPASAPAAAKPAPAAPQSPPDSKPAPAPAPAAKATPDPVSTEAGGPVNSTGETGAAPRPGPATTK